jgi:hypothetical protein
MIHHSPYSLSLSNIPTIQCINRHNIQQGYQSIINNPHALPMLLEHQILMLISILIIQNISKHQQAIDHHNNQKTSTMMARIVRNGLNG